MFERFTEQARRVIFFARYEASQYGSSYIETEHLLLGILRERRCTLEKLFPRKSAAESEIRKEIEKRITQGKRTPTSVEMPISLECRKVLMLAQETADSLGHKPIEPEHLLIALLRVETCLAAKVLKERGVTPEPIETELAKRPRQERESSPAPHASIALNAILAGFKSFSAEELMHCFADSAEFIDGLGARWSRAEIEKRFEALFAPYAKKNATYIVEGTLAQTNRLSVYTILWKNALLASEERAWMHRMTIVLKLEDAEWKILFAQVTLVKPFSASAS
ncbi:MAG TPA: Clp protease N-terminal domain-containing protein [Candidatus Acidoferrales bacterium]|nr:Clp protease N-terminal domain-containing protein [Candidatus Acidoferrales bacterium]